jgi:hypothetical protein
MKRLKLNKLSLFLAIALLGISLNGFSQDKKEHRMERKELRKSVMLANFNIIDSLIKAKSFVIEADFLQNGWGERRNVSSSINFIKVNSSKCVIQTGSNFNLGYNGIGGVTAEGYIGKWVVNKNFKNLSYNVRFSVTTNIGLYDVVLDLASDAHASATISGLTAGRLTWVGHIVSSDNSRVFKGQNTI